MKAEPWNLFQFFDNVVKTNKLDIQSLIFEFEHDPSYNKVTKQIDFDVCWDDDSDHENSYHPIIETFTDYLKDCLIFEISTISHRIERLYFSFNKSSYKISFLKSIKSKVENLIKKCQSFNDPYSEIITRHLVQLQSEIEEKYAMEFTEGSIMNTEKELQRKTPKININLNRDQLGALIYLLMETDIIDDRMKASQLARLIESNVLLLDSGQNYTPAKKIDVLLSQMKQDDKNYGKILNEVIEKFKTSSYFVP